MILNVILKATYDIDSDSLYIKLTEEKQAHTVALNNFMMVDLDAKQHITGIEIICFSKLNKKDLKL